MNPFRVLRNLFRCRHVNHSFPISTADCRQMSVFCRDCGQQLAYDWNNMRVLNTAPPDRNPYRNAV